MVHSVTNPLQDIQTLLLSTCYKLCSLTNVSGVETFQVSGTRIRYFILQQAADGSSNTAWVSRSFGKAELYLHTVMHVSWPESFRVLWHCKQVNKKINGLEVYAILHVQLCVKGPCTGYPYRILREGSRAIINVGTCKLGFCIGRFIYSTTSSSRPDQCF